MPEADPPPEPGPAPADTPSRMRLGLWALALAALVLLGAATPLGATPSDLAAPVQETAGTVANPCVDDVVQGIGEWDCLPFYRWANEADSFSSNFGATEIGAANVMQPLVTFLYGMAGLMWRLLQWVTRTALAFDLFNRRDGHASTPVALQPIDAGFEAASNIVLSGVGLTVLGLAVLVVIARSARTSETPFRDLARPFLCFAVLLVLLARAAPDGAGGAQAGSPAWVAERGVGMSNLIADQISQVAPEATTGEAPENLLDCHHYVATLRQSFEEDGDYSEDLVGSVAFQPHLASLMSSLWETAYLDLWIEAQFGGDTDLARRAYCRMLEDRSEISPADQSAIQQAALAAAGASVPAAGRQGTAPFGRFNDSKDFRRGMIAWAVCGWYQDRSGMKEESGGALHDLSGPGFAVNPEFRLMWNLGSPPSEMGEGTCSDWWGTDGSGTTKPDPRGTKWGVRDGDGPFQFGTADDITEAFTVFDDEQIAEVAGSGFTGTVAPYEESDREDLPAARQWVFALNGHNLTRSVPHAILAIVIAAVYLWAIGGLALGTLVAQFLTVLVCVALPLLLVVGMWPTEAAGRIFTRYLKIGAGSLFAKAVFVSLLAVLLTIISVITRLGELTGAFEAAAGGGAGFGAAMLQAAAPLVAIFAMRWALRDLGMGNVFSLRGAMGVTGRLARGAGAYAPGALRGAAAGAAGAVVSSRQRLEDRRLTRQARRAAGEAAAGAAAGAAEERDGAGAEDGGAAEGAGAGGGGPGAAGPGDGDGAVAGEIGAGSSPRRRGAALLGAVTAGALTAGERGLKAAAPLAGAVFGCVRDRTSRPQVSPRIVPRRHGRAPTADELAGLGDDKVGGRHARHVETVVAAGNGADPVRSARHPDIRTPSAITGRHVATDGRVLGVTASGVRVHLTTPGWARRDGQRLATPSGYRDQEPAARTS
jgi:hypothetical protein